MKNAIVFGATGLVGSTLVKKLQVEEGVEKIVVVNRRSQHYQNNQVKEVISEYSNLKLDLLGLEADCCFVCLGTTMKKAGSKEKFKAVDYKLPIEIAGLTKEMKIQTLIVISSIGANANTSNFYLKVKGEMEREISQIGPEQTYIVRPSMILGDRKEHRIGEAIGKFLIRLIEPLMVGKLKRYRGINADQIAAAMIAICKKPIQKKIIESEELKKMAKSIGY